MVNRERVQLLVDALRSGEYQQTTGLLVLIAEDEPISFCCLGVACEVAIRNGATVTKAIRPSGVAGVYDGNPSTMPPAVHDWYGFPSDNPTLLDHADRDWTATECNDELEMTFPEIADLFEARFLR